MVRKTKYLFLFLFLITSVFLAYKLLLVDNGRIGYKPINDESCTQCHTHSNGFSENHNPKLIGCSSCHLGDSSSKDKGSSHKGMIKIPGNLSDASRTCGKCHPNELNNIQHSLMTTNSGLVSTDKYVFGEIESPDILHHIDSLGYSSADKHIRSLCANCHLGSDKKEYGEITQMSRGGGCLACHLNYSLEKSPENHPSIDINISDNHCFGCHSRSSRISTNYEGWSETVISKENIPKTDRFKSMEDGRVYEFVEEDVHHKAGLLCIDCHNSSEVMGDGKDYKHEEDAVKVRCDDCHFSDEPNVINYSNLDSESARVFFLRKYTHTDKKMLATNKGNLPLVNTYIDSLGNLILIGKKDQKLHKVSKQGETCSKDNVHNNLDCSTCHSSWTSKCIGCHNEYDADAKGYDLLVKKDISGQWSEYVSEFSHSLPSLGVRIEGEEKTITCAIPGMVMTIDHGSYPDDSLDGISFHRLFAPNSPHTTVKKSRTCKSCHNNPYAIGFGAGDIKIDNKISFISEYDNNENDNLPEDAWIPFLEEIDLIKKSTRKNFRPFSIKEQKRILMVGVCLTCHKDDSPMVEGLLTKGLDHFLIMRSEKCIIPMEIE